MLTEADVRLDNAIFNRNLNRNSTPIRDLSLVSLAPNLASPPKSKRRQFECRMPSLVPIKPRAANRSCRIRSNRPLTISSPPRCDTPDDMPLSMLNRFSESGFSLPLPSLTPIRSVSSAVVGSTYIDDEEATYKPKTRDFDAPGTSRDIYVEKPATLIPSEAKQPSPAEPLEEPPRKIFKKCDPSKANLIKSSKRAKRRVELSDGQAGPSCESSGTSQLPGPTSDPFEGPSGSGLTLEAPISGSSLALPGSNSASSGSSRATVGYNQVGHVSVGSSSATISGSSLAILGTNSASSGSSQAAVGYNQVDRVSAGSSSVMAWSSLDSAGSSQNLGAGLISTASNAIECSDSD